MEGFSVLDRKPTHVLGFPLTIGQQLWLSFLLPSLALLIIYIADLATGITVGLQHLSERHYLASLLTFALLYLPPMVSYLSRLCQPPDTKDVGVVFAWFFTETAAFILFPIRPLQCIGERVFWSIEALRHGDPMREEALEEYEDTRCELIETYFFSHAFLGAGPQALLQSVFLLSHLSSANDTTIVQVICVLCSLATLAVVTSSYERYESQVDGGRHQVWGRPEYEQPQFNKAMDEDNPLGSLCLFLFWFFFLTARTVSLVLAGYFYPTVVLGVCAIHIILSFLYLLPSQGYKNSILFKIFLSILYVFSIIEVNVRLKNTNIFYALYYFLSVAENIGLTLLWALTVQKCPGSIYYHFFYFLAVTHVLAFLFLFIYTKFLKPKTREVIIY